MKCDKAERPCLISVVGNLQMNSFKKFNTHAICKLDVIHLKLMWWIIGFNNWKVMSQFQCLVGELDFPGQILVKTSY